MINLSVLLASSLFFTSCAVKDSGETGDTGGGDTGTTPVETEIDTFSYEVNSSEWTYEVMLVGWGSAVTIDIYQFEGGYTWEEHHELDEIDFDENGQWDQFGITLPIVYDWEKQQDNVNTLFTAEMEPTLTWMITAYDMDGFAADCAVTGKRTEYYAEYNCWELEMN